MSSAGLHKKTIDLDTGVTLYHFGYDQDNNLVSITDRFGNVTSIEWVGDVPTSITSPDGITTTLTIDANNHLTRITYPDGNYYETRKAGIGIMPGLPMKTGISLQKCSQAKATLPLTWITLTPQVNIPHPLPIQQGPRPCLPNPPMA
jgi:YD repeat-containing protein